MACRDAIGTGKSRCDSILKTAWTGVRVQTVEQEGTMGLQTIMGPTSMLETWPDAICVGSGGATNEDTTGGGGYEKLDARQKS